MKVREDLKLALHSQRTEGSIDEHEILFGHLKTFVIFTFCNTLYNNFSRHFLSLNACKIYASYQKGLKPGTSLVAQWLRLRAPNAGGPGSIPGQGTRSHMHAATKSPHATTKEPVSDN